MIPTPAKPIPSPLVFVLAAMSWSRADSRRRMPPPLSTRVNVRCLRSAATACHVAPESSAWPRSPSGWSPPRVRSRRREGPRGGAADGRASRPGASAPSPPPPPLTGVGRGTVGEAIEAPLEQPGRPRRLDPTASTRRGACTRRDRAGHDCRRCRRSRRRRAPAGEWLRRSRRARRPRTLRDHGQRAARKQPALGIRAPKLGDPSLQRLPVTAAA